MAGITCKLGDISFDYIPEIIQVGDAVLLHSAPTISGAVINEFGLEKNVITIEGKYISEAVRGQILALYESCKSDASATVFDSGFGLFDVLITDVTFSPVIGKSDGYSYKITMMKI